MTSDHWAEAATEERGTPMMVIGALVGGMTAYLFHAWGGRALGPDDFAPIGVMWTVAFIAVAVLYLPMEQWVTREATRRKNPLRGGRGVVLGVMGVATVAAGFTTGWTLPTLTEQSGIHVVQMVVLLVGYGCFWTGKGMLQGGGRYDRVGWMLCSEGVVRLAVAGIMLAMGAGPVGLGWAMAAAPWVVFGFAWGRHLGWEGHAAGGGVFVCRYALGSAAAHLLVAGAPLAVTYLGGSPAEVSVVFVVFVLFRAPLSLMYSLQGRVLPPLVRMVGRGEVEPLRRLARRLWLGAIAVAAVAAGMGFLLGPSVVRLLMGSEFVTSAGMAALVASGTIMAAGVQLVAQTLVAGARTASLAAAWLAGLAVGGVVVWVSGLGPVLSVVTGFWVGEATVLMVVGWLARTGGLSGKTGYPVQSDGGRIEARD